MAGKEKGVEVTGELGGDRSGSSDGSTEAVIFLPSRFTQVVYDNNS